MTPRRQPVALQPGAGGGISVLKPQLQTTECTGHLEINEKPFAFSPRKRYNGFSGDQPRRKEDDMTQQTKAAPVRKIKGLPRSKDPVKIFEHFEIADPRGLTTMDAIASQIERLLPLNLKQLHRLSDAMAAIGAEPVQATRSTDPQQAKLKVAYAIQEIAFQAQPEFARGHRKARQNAATVFATPDTINDEAGDDPAEEDTMPEKTKATKKATKATKATKAKATKDKAPKAPKEPKRTVGRGAGLRVREFECPVTGNHYNFEKGFGMLAVVINAIKTGKSRKTWAIDPKDEALVPTVRKILELRDKQCGKEPNPKDLDYTKKVRAYLNHGAKHLDGRCDCSEVNLDLLAKPPVA